MKSVKNRLKQIIGIVLSFLMTATMIPILPVAAASKDYSDVSAGDWFYDSVQYVSDKGLMNGMSGTTFEPQTTMSRAMVVSVLHRVEGEPAPTILSSFKDVPVNTWFTNSVAWASADGIVNGYNEDTFGPNDDVTREQIATILFRYAGKKGFDVSKCADLSKYSDDEEVSDWAKDALSWTNAEGLIVGVDDTTLSPASKTTRAQVATILQRLSEGILNPEEQPSDNPGDNSVEQKATFTVTFGYNYDNKGTYKTVEIKDGEKAASVADPTREGYSFSGWYTEATNGMKYDPNKAVTENLKLYAHWTKKSSSGGGGSGSGGGGGGTPTPATYTVTFKSNGGSAVESQRVKENQKATKPATDPTKEGSTFVDWYSDSALTTAYDFDAAVTRNITLYAKWEENNEPGNPGVISDSWDQIIASINDGTYKDKYNIGDTKELDLGSEGIVDMQIAAFNADELVDGSGTAAITWISKQLLNTEHRMNPACDFNSLTGIYNLGTGGIGGWKESEMRNWLNSSIKPLIPSTVRSSIKQVMKYSTSLNTSRTQVKNELTYDEVWIPSMREVFGDSSIFESSGPTYASLFTINNDRIKKHFNSLDKANGSIWWLRSINSSISFHYVSSTGYYNYSSASNPWGVALGFCL